MSDHARNPDSELQSALCEDHAQLLARLEDLLDDETSSAQSLQTAWERFEASLLVHLLTEEEALLPAFELVRPDDAARLRAEHHRMRELVAELSGGFERDDVDRELIARLLGILHVTAALKEQGLYVWADASLRPRSKARIVERLRSNRP